MRRPRMRRPPSIAMPAGAPMRELLFRWCYNQRGTAEQYVRKGKNAIKLTRLSCRTFGTHTPLPTASGARVYRLTSGAAKCAGNEGGYALVQQSSPFQRFSGGSPVSRRLRSPFAHGDGGLPLPKLLRSTILASKPSGIWRMSVKHRIRFRERYGHRRIPPRPRRSSYDID